MYQYTMRFVLCFRGCRYIICCDQSTLLVGVVSRKDLLRASLGKQDLTSLPVNIIMTRMPNIAMCRREDSLYDIAMELIERQIDAMPVVKDTKQGLEVVGRITKQILHVRL